MTTAIKCDSCGHENQFEQLEGDHRPQCLACGNPSPAPANRKPVVFRVSAADVVKPALPRLQTYEELGFHDRHRKAVEEELTKDEKLLWLGRPSLNREVYPPKDNVVVLGVVLFVLAGAFLALPLFVKSIPFVFAILFSGVLVLIGFLCLNAPRLFNPATSYHACYVVTNRRAILLEWVFLAAEPTSFNLTGARRKSYYPHELLGLERLNNPRVAGAGDLIFEYIFAVGKAVTSYPGMDGKVTRTDTPQRIARGFLNLDHAGEVEHLIRTTLLANLEKNGTRE
jgi:hypothetical protein